MRKKQRNNLLSLLGILLLVGAFAHLSSKPAQNSQLSQDKPKEGPKTTETKRAKLADSSSPDFQIIKYDKEKSFGGKSLIPLEGNERVVLIDMQGNIEGSWNIDAVRGRLEEDGSLLALHGTNWGKDTKEQWKALRTVLRHYNRDGEIRWEYRSDNILHHDFLRLDNGNLLILERVYVPQELYAQIKDPNMRNEQIRSDAIIEVNQAGEVVWRWDAHEHLDLNNCGRKGCLAAEKAPRRAKGTRDWTHTNTLTLIPENKWYREGHKEFKPGNLMILPRNWWTVLIIDRESGEPVWEYSGDYRGGLSGGHESHMIEEGLPGAGNVLVYDNGRKIHQGESFVLEINPVTKELVWVYDVGPEMFSPARGSVQRLPNGNTLISSDKEGRCFEVTPEKEIVWEFKSKYELNRCRRYY